MGLLDQLKQQAESTLNERRESESNRVRRLEQSHERMKGALHYWLEFCKALNVVKPEVRRNYFVEGSTQLQGLRQVEYNVNSRRVSVDHHDYIESIEIRFQCVGDSKVTVEKESDAIVTRMRELLWQHGLKFQERLVRREGAFVERGTFIIEPEVTARLTFVADVENDRIKLTVRNVERLVEYSYVYYTDEFGQPLFEEIGKAILGQPNQLRRMGRHQAALFGQGGLRRRAADVADA